MELLPRWPHLVTEERLGCKENAAEGDQSLAACADRFNVRRCHSREQQYIPPGTYALGYFIQRE